MNNDNTRQIGIRGDCVYARYSSPNQSDIHDVFNIAIKLNTFVRKVLIPAISNTKIKVIRFGIGCASSQCSVIKAGKKGTGINDTFWIGDAVVDASNLNGIANHPINNYNSLKYKSIAIDDTFYPNMIAADKLKGIYKVDWFQKEVIDLRKTHETVYFCNLNF